MPTPLIDDPGLNSLRRWAELLDSAFRFPGTRARFGLDPIVGLVPGIGDLVSPIFAILILFHAVRLRVPRVVLLRMILNALIDFGIGTIPVVGDAFDFAWKSNAWNMTLLETHAGGLRRPSAGDWLFVSLCALFVFAATAIPTIIIVWITVSIGRRLI
jgi:uncharacterized protein DUF4112